MILKKCQKHLNNFLISLLHLYQRQKYSNRRDDAHFFIVVRYITDLIWNIHYCQPNLIYICLRSNPREKHRQCAGQIPFRNVASRVTLEHEGQRQTGGGYWKPNIDLKKLKGTYYPFCNPSSPSPSKLKKINSFCIISCEYHFFIPKTWFCFEKMKKKIEEKFYMGPPHLWSQITFLGRFFKNC